jgi:hypothetical protein
VVRIHSGAPYSALAVVSGAQRNIEIAGPDLARSLADLGPIDEYRIYLHPSG